MNQTKSTFDRMMENPEWKADFENGYKEFLISEFLCEQMEHSNLSVRELASKAGDDSEKYDKRCFLHIII